MKTFKSNGKLLLTGEYVVLDGAKALAIPTVFGQSLSVSCISSSRILWKSFDYKDDVWFKMAFELSNTNIIMQDKQNDTAIRLCQIFNSIRSLNPGFIPSDGSGFSITTTLDFAQEWGLGTSSTLINNLAQWANVDPYKLLKLTFGGSGYDIACASINTPITYQLISDKNRDNNNRLITPVHFNPSFKNHLYFVYLNKKQNSRDGIAHYKKLKHNLPSIVNEINTITEAIIDCNNLELFQKLITAHEQIIGKLTRQTTVQSCFFKDFNGSIKSLGAWGGDFILVASLDNPLSYFKQKGFTTILPYQDMVF